MDLKPGLTPGRRQKVGWDRTQGSTGQLRKGAERSLGSAREPRVG